MLLKSSLACLLGAAALTLTSGAHGQQGAFAEFAAHNAQSRTQVDYEAWSLILTNITFDVGYSDRTLPGPRAQVTGTRLNQQSRSRYRNEGNRVAYHLMEDVHREAISTYRAELEALPGQVDLSTLNRNEQLAYWLNLHNAVLIDEVAQRYPMRRIDSESIDGAPFLDAPVMTIDGIALSLNDIRFNIVQAGWNDPRIIYGFHLGAVGGPSLRDEAFTGARVWNQLESNAREFVASLRGIDHIGRHVRISPLYQAHAALFPGGVDELKAHLRAFADDEVDAHIAEIRDEPDYLDFDWGIADLTNGRRGCSGGANATNISVISGEGTSSLAIDCQVLPPQALDLFQVVIQRRLEFLRSGRLGRVTVRDLPSPDEDDPDRRVIINLPADDEESE